MGVITTAVGMAVYQVYQQTGRRTEESEKKSVPNLGYLMFLGIMGCTLYGQIVGIFGKISMKANLFLLIIVTGYFLWQKKYIKTLFLCGKGYRCCFVPDKISKGKDFSKVEAGIIAAISIIALLAYAFASAGPAKLIDTDWYHAQAIRWLEEYGVVKGLGNLFPSLGYNNGQHYFDALFSMKWLLGQSLRNTGGFFGIVLFLHGITRISSWKRRYYHMADMIAVWEIAYSIIVTAFFADPYVDTLPNALVLVIMTEWIGRLEEGNNEIKPMILDCLLAVFSVVCKLSVIMVLLLALYPFLILLRQKRAKDIFLYFSMGLLIALPFFITNVITTGYLIYPVALLDFFPVRWKMDAKILSHTVDSMVAFARMPLATMEEALSSGLSWIPVWFKAESISHQLLYVAIVLISLYDIGNIIKDLLGNIKKKDNNNWAYNFPMLWPRICVYCGLVYWFFSIPQVKYCWSFLILPLAIVPMYYWKERKRGILENGIMIMSLGILLIYSGFYGLRTLGYMKDGILNYPVMQADYKQYDFEEISIGNHFFYIRKEGGDIACGYYAFPYLDNPENQDKLVVGESLRDGFWMSNRE